MWSYPSTRQPFAGHGLLFQSSGAVQQRGSIELSMGQHRGTGREEVPTQIAMLRIGYIYVHIYIYIYIYGTILIELGLAMFITWKLASPKWPWWAMVETSIRWVAGLRSAVSNIVIDLGGTKHASVADATWYQDSIESFVVSVSRSFMCLPGCFLPNHILRVCSSQEPLQTLGVPPARGPNWERMG